MGTLIDQLHAALDDRYAIQHEIGRGGMASVWLGHDVRHDRQVAIKVLHPELAGAIGVDRFVQEIRLTAKLQHPAIVPVLDSGVVQTSAGESLPWYAMPYIDGESLRARLDRDRQLPIEEALRITATAGAALESAHREGVVHRDIKPENLLLTGGHVYVADFGIAKALVDTGGERLTSTGIVIGTPAYMSPEQSAGEVLDARCDQYSLASVLYEMLAGEPPFTGRTAHAIIGRRLAEPARPLRPVRSAVPIALETALLKALERAPADRYADVGAFVDALRSATVPSMVPQEPRVRRRKLAASMAVAVVLVVAVAFASTILPRHTNASTTTRDSTALALYKRGKLSLAKRTDEGASDALVSFKGAIQRDSTFGAAWAGLAQTYQQAAGRSFIVPGSAGDSILRLAVEAVDRAVALAGQNPEVLYTQAMVSRLIDPTSMVSPIKTLRQAVALDPKASRAWQQLAISEYDAGSPGEAMRDWHRSASVDPSYTEALAFLALGFMWSRQYDSATYWADSTIAVNPNYLLGRTAEGYIAVEQGNHARAAAAFDATRRLSSGVEIPNALAGIALVAARAGRKQEAARLLAQVESLMVKYTPVPPHNSVYIAEAYAALGNHTRAIEWLEQFAPRAGLHFQLHLRCDPALDPLADDPRFRALLIKPRPTLPHGC